MTACRNTDGLAASLLTALALVGLLVVTHPGRGMHAGGAATPPWSVPFGGPTLPVR